MTTIRDVIGTVRSILAREKADGLSESVAAALTRDESADKIKELISSEEVSALAYFADDDLFQLLISGEPDKIIEELTSTRGEIPKAILNIFQIGMLKSELEKFKQAALRSEPIFDSAQLSRNVITQVSGTPFNIGFVPVVRFTLANHLERRLLLDTTLDWDDIAFLIERLSQNLKGSFVSAVESLKKSDWDNAQEILGTKYLDRLQDTVRNLTVILEKSRDLGLSKKSDESADEDAEA